MNTSKVELAKNGISLEINGVKVSSVQIPWGTVPIDFAPAVEEHLVITGDQLVNGMVVLIEDRNFRQDPSITNPSVYDRAKANETSRWCVVTNLRPYGGGGRIIAFDGVYADGTIRSRQYSTLIAWAVLKDSEMELFTDPFVAVATLTPKEDEFQSNITFSQYNSSPSAVEPGELRRQAAHVLGLRLNANGSVEKDEERDQRQSDEALEALRERLANRPDSTQIVEDFDQSSFTVTTEDEQADAESDEANDTDEYDENYGRYGGYIRTPYRHLSGYHGPVRGITIRVNQIEEGDIISLGGHDSRVLANNPNYVGEFHYLKVNPLAEKEDVQGSLTLPGQLIIDVQRPWKRKAQ